MLTALGYEFYDKKDRLLAPIFENLGKIARISADNVLPELKECHFQIACDVTNPLCGENGAVYVYGPQKGVRLDERVFMDSQMRQYAARTAECFGVDHSEDPGAGAAGGLGFAFLSYFPNVELRPGIQIVLDAVKFEEALEGADYVITGEGRMDSQTANGKVPVGVARIAKQHGVKKVFGFAGGVTDDAGACNAAGIDAFFPIVRGVCTLDEAMDNFAAKKNMTLSVEQVFRLL
jgi:glycerate kinase